MLARILALGPSFLKPEWWFDKAGSAALPVVTAIVFAESGLLFGFFLPGDSLLFFTGFLTSSAAKDEAPFAEFAEHIPALPIVLVCLAVAAIVGDQVGYLFGKRVGPSLFNRPNSRLFKAENVAKAHVFFEKHGPKSIVLARFVPIVRTFTPIVAGIADMRVPHVRHVQRHRRPALGGRHHHARPLPRRDRVLPRQHRVRHRRRRADLAAARSRSSSTGTAEAIARLAERRHARRQSLTDPTRKSSRGYGEPLGDDAGDLGVGALEVVALVLDPVVGDRPGDRRGPAVQAPPACRTGHGYRHEQPRHRDVRHVLDPQPVRPPRRVERVGDRHDADDVLRRGSPSAPAATIEQIRPPIERPPTTTRLRLPIAASSSRTAVHQHRQAGQAPGGRRGGTGSRRGPPTSPSGP